MRIDCHVHSYPLFMPGGLKWYVPIPSVGGLSVDQLTYSLKKLENSTGEMHGAFFGGNHPKLLPENPQDSGFLKRVLPMIENHEIQLIGVTSWDNLKPLYDLSVATTQMQGIRSMTDQRGLAIIDQPKSSHKKQKKQINRGNLSPKGEATIEELINLPQEIKERTFLCYDGMLPYVPFIIDYGKEAEKVSELTELKLLGGSDVILNPSTLFSAYTSADTTDIRELLENPSLFGELHKGAAPWYNLERLQRCCSALEEGLMKEEKRVQRHDGLMQSYLNPFDLF